MRVLKKYKRQNLIYITRKEEFRNFREFYVDFNVLL